MAEENIDADMDQLHARISKHLLELKDCHDKNGKATFYLDRRLKSDAAYLEEFKKDPAAVANAAGVALPEGYHCHFVDEHNEYFPPEGDAVSQLQKGKRVPVWGRLEIRYAVGPGCFTACVCCD